MGKDERNYRMSHTFIFRIWSESPLTDQSHGKWRFSLEDVQSKTRYGFRSITELISFIEQTLGIRNQFLNSE